MPTLARLSGIGFGFLQTAVRVTLLALGPPHLAVTLSPSPNTGLAFLLGLVGT